MKKTKVSETEESYVIRAQQGDEDAFNYLTKKYHNLAFYIALKICHCDADADDIVQESFIEIHKSIHLLKEPKYFKAWMNRVIFSKATKLFRSNKDIILPDDDPTFTRYSQEHRRYMIPDKNMKFESDAEVLRHCVDTLPAKMRTMIYLQYFEQMSIQEIAFACNIPEGTVKSRLNYARKELKGILSRYEQENDTNLNFSMHGLEAILVTIFAKEATQYLPLLITPKSFTFSFKGHIIEPSMLLMATIGTCVSVGVGAVVIPHIQEALSNKPVNIVHQVQDSTSNQTFPSVEFQGVTITSEKAAYQALTTFAHCHVELETYSEEEQAEAMRVYYAMEENGGAYYELLKNRGYLDKSS